MWHGKARQGLTNKDKLFFRVRRGMARQGKTGYGEAWQGEARRGSKPEDQDGHFVLCGEGMCVLADEGYSEEIKEAYLEECI